MRAVAPVISTGNLDELVVVSTESFTVYGFMLVNLSGSTAGVGLMDKNFNSYGSVAVKPGDTKISEIVWLADNGLMISPAGNAILYTVYHSQTGT